MNETKLNFNLEQYNECYYCTLESLHLTNGIMNAQVGSKGVPQGLRREIIICSYIVYCILSTEICLLN